MAIDTKSTVETTAKPGPVNAATVAPTDSIYSVEYLADNYKAFNTSREIVVVALRLAGKKTATFAEAKGIIEKFKKKEVK